MRKVLVSLPEPDLRAIDAAARKAGETRIDDPKMRRAFSRLISRAERRKPISTSEALAARDRGRR